MNLWPIQDFPDEGREVAQPEMWGDQIRSIFPKTDWKWKEKWTEKSVQVPGTMIC